MMMTRDEILKRVNELFKPTNNLYDPPWVAFHSVFVGHSGTLIPEPCIEVRNAPKLERVGDRTMLADGIEWASSPLSFRAAGRVAAPT